MKLLTTFIFSLVMLLNCYSQTSQTKSEIPENVKKWIAGELKKSKFKESKDFDINHFFRIDSARIIGYIKGYNSEKASKSGIIYNENTLTNQDFPTRVKISSDGRFESKILIRYPIYTYMALQNGNYNFYIEPGSTVVMIIDPSVENKKESVQYLGNNKEMNIELASFELKDKSYDDLTNQIKTLSEQDFKKLVSSEWENEKSRMNEIFERKKYSDKAKRVLKNEVDLAYLDQFFTFSMNRPFYAKEDSTNAILQTPISQDYFDFINKIDLNDHTLLINKEFKFTINRIEYSPIFPMRDYINNEHRYKKVDSVGLASYHGDLPLLWNIAKLRSISNQIKNSDGISQNEKMMSDVAEVKKNITQSFLLSELDAQYASFQTEKEGYELPKTESADIFKKLIAPYKGKIVVVDFWAENCGPCRASIESSLALRKHLKDHPSLEFVYITDVGNTSESFYKEYIQKNFMNNSYLVSEDDYLALRELFRFNGIPRYVLVDEQGNIRTDDFRMYNSQYLLAKYFPEKIKAEDFKIVIKE